jgi:hypothetical protein
MITKHGQAQNFTSVENSVSHPCSLNPDLRSLMDPDPDPDPDQNLISLHLSTCLYLMHGLLTLLRVCGTRCQTRESWCISPAVRLPARPPTFLFR